jgi:hypothetical protein
LIDLGSIADGIVRMPSGIWETRHGSADRISYPEEGSDLCFSVEESSFWFAHRNAVIAAAVKRFPPRGAIFDIGGGNGVVAKALKESGNEVVLIEPSRDGAAHAIRRGIENVVCGTLADARFRPGTLGAAGLFDVVEHIEDDVAFLSALRPLLRAGAPVYLTVPAGASLWSADDEAAGHFRRYRRRTLAAVLDAAGFDVLYATYFFVLLTLPIALFRALPSRLGRRRAVDEQSIAKEHGANGNWSRRLIGALFAGESSIISRGHSLPFGASVLAVARGRNSK